MQKDKRKRGRPPVEGDEALMEPITVRFSAPIMARINELREKRFTEKLERPPKSTIVRELVVKGLKA